MSKSTFCERSMSKGKVLPLVTTFSFQLVLFLISFCSSGANFVRQKNLPPVEVCHVSNRNRSPPMTSSFDFQDRKSVV